MKDISTIYQFDLYKKFARFCADSYWVYPPYCKTNDYFEEYFYKNFFHKIVKNKIYTNLIYIPINWTLVLKSNPWNFENNSRLKIIQDLLNNLNPNYRYFTICMHDNAPMLKLPNFTLNFSAGHCCQKESPMLKDLTESFRKIFENNIEDFRQNIPIPLIVKNRISKLVPTNNKYSKKYLASFIGSDSHELRLLINNKYQNNKNFFIRLKNNPNMENSMEDVNIFIEKSLESYFALCPRGWGPTSYRLYEVMQLNCVPVYISDIFWLPYENEINWNDICVFIKPEQIDSLEDILKEELESGNYQKKLKYINEIYDQYFTFEKMFDKIIQDINCGMP